MDEGEDKPVFELPATPAKRMELAPQLQRIRLPKRSIDPMGEGGKARLSQFWPGPTPSEAPRERRQSMPAQREDVEPSQRKVFSIDLRVVVSFPKRGVSQPRLSVNTPRAAPVVNVLSRNMNKLKKAKVP